MPLLLAHAGAQNHNVSDARRKLLFEAVEMIIALGQYQGRSSTANRVDDIFADSPGSRLVVDQLLIQGLKFDALIRIRVSRRLECCGLNEHEMLEGARRRLCASIYLMSNRTALHEDDRMVTVLACDSCRQAKDESGPGLTRNLFETVRRQMVAFVNDHVAVIGDEVSDHALADETLNDADVNPSGRSTSASADSTDRFGRYIEERRYPLDPLIEQLAPMDQHERIDAALSDKPRSDNGLAKCGGGRQDTILVAQHGVCCGLLLGPKLTLKGHRQTTTVAAFVTNGHANAKIGECLANVIQAATGQPDVMREVLGARDDAGLVVRKSSPRPVWSHDSK
jgi:hypothetical protein